MLIHKAFKFRIYPNREQQSALAIQFNCARFVYNFGLAVRKNHYEQHGKGLSYNDTAYMLTVIKPFLPWLKEANAQVLQQKLKDLDGAYQKFFKGQAKHPRFKKKGRVSSIRYPQRFKIKDNQIRLPKVGNVRAVLHRPIEGKPKNCTVFRTSSGKYFVLILCEVENQDPVQKPGRVGIDLGLKDFVTLSTGEKIQTPKYLRKTERRLRIYQRRLSRKQKGSSNRNKARLQVALHHERVANQRRDFHHKLSHSLISRFGFIAFENLNVAGMLKNRRLAKSIADAGWSQFVGFCVYKANWTGGQIEKRDRFFASSKLCSVCGEINHQLKLSDREWICSGCGAIHDRDKNAAINILNGTTAGAAESYALGDTIPVRESAQEAGFFNAEQLTITVKDTYMTHQGRA